MILIAESGSSKTNWVGICRNGEILKFDTNGLNPYYVDAVFVAKEIKEKLSENVSENINEIYFYGTGITDESKGKIIKEGLELALGYSPKITTQSDVVGAAKSLFGNRKGIACILGTGSNSCYWDGSKISLQIPPLGFWLGDEGSGAHMGKQLVLNYLHKEMPLEIRELFESKFGKLDRIEILNKSYHEPLPNKYFGGYSYFINNNKTLPYFKTLIDNSLALFYEKYLLKYPEEISSKVGFVGSIAKVFEENLREIGDKHDLQIDTILEKPIDGLVVFHKNNL